MTDDQHGEGTPQGRTQGAWERLPQGDYDDGATTFVQLPEGGIDALLASDTPLAAPGHGYVPPPIPAAPGADADPSAPGAWGAPAEGVQWPDPGSASPDVAQDTFMYNPGATGQWAFEEPARGDAAPGHDVTGQWSIPVADGDLPDESGEFSTSSLVEQWGGTPPATLPGGAAAPWATEAAGQLWSPESEEAAGHPGREMPAEAPVEPSGGPYTAFGVRVDPGAPEAAQEAPEPSGALDATETDERAGAAEAVDAPYAEPAAEEPPAAEEVPVAGDPPVAVEPPAEEPSEPGPDPSAAPQAQGESAEETGADDPASAHHHDEHPVASYVLRVNGADRPVTDAWIGESLLYVLRERLGLAGAKDGCSQGECGACNVQVDGRLVASCLVPAVTAAGSEVRTVEGLAVDGRPSDVQRALAKCGAVQCGFCVPGMAMTVHDLLEGNPAPTELEARQALCGNLCRCSGYRGVLDAVREVVAEREAHTEAESAQDADEARIPHQAGPGAGSVNPSAFDPPDAHHRYGQDGGQA
ncbi:2Fe-2S iron-sulfur cluster-binding protein [Streptomyces avermitilis]|uniref:2Fe-2S iron-sulfur cluster-binding protein n=1 Tax=Streptomyces avermitilis TaxID=33903 RepID=UPI0038127F83